MCYDCSSNQKQMNSIPDLAAPGILNILKVNMSKEITTEQTNLQTPWPFPKSPVDEFVGPHQPVEAATPEGDVATPYNPEAEADIPTPGEEPKNKIEWDTDDADSESENSDSDSDGDAGTDETDELLLDDFVSYDISEDLAAEIELYVDARIAQKVKAVRKTATRGTLTWEAKFKALPPALQAKIIKLVKNGKPGRGHCGYNWTGTLKHFLTPEELKSGWIIAGMAGAEPEAFMALIA